jgi:predicted RNase H-like HicB family nuclease
VDLPGVNAQEKTKEELIETLTIGAQKILATEISLKIRKSMIKNWAKSCGEPNN